MNYEQKYLKYKNKYLALKNNNIFNAKEMKIPDIKEAPYNFYFITNQLTINYNKLNKKIILVITSNNSGTLNIYEDQQLLLTINYNESNYNYNNSGINKYINLSDFLRSMTDAVDYLLTNTDNNPFHQDATKQMISNINYLLRIHK